MTTKLVGTGVEFPDATTQTTTGLPLTGGTMTGTIAGFTSTGIDDNATSTAITIDSSENVGIGTVSPAAELHISKSADASNTELILENTYNASSSTDESVQIQGRFGGYDASYITTGKEEDWSDAATRSSYMAFTTRKDGTLAEKLRITGDGRGLSQFTAKAWARFDTGGYTGHAPAINNSHNISSITDYAIGDVGVSFTNSIAATATAVWSADLTQNLGDVGMVTNYYGMPSTTMARCRVFDNTGNQTDSDVVHLQVFGD